MEIRECNKEIFKLAYEQCNPKNNKFAKTFMAKAKAMELWDKCFGIYDPNGSLLGAVVVTLSKRKPCIANLQLLHVFHEHRRKGYGRCLMEFALSHALDRGAEYFRVSSEPSAVKFYESLGLRMICEQKSGTQLSFSKIEGKTFDLCYNDIEDAQFQKVINYKGRGGCTKLLGENSLSNGSDGE